MDAFGWTVVGSVAGVVGAAAAIVFGVLPLLRARTRIPGLPGDGAASQGVAAPSGLPVHQSAAEGAYALPAAVLTVGREEELRVAVVNVLSRPPVPIVVLGGAGIGKTNLTIALIHDEQICDAFGARRFLVRCDGASSAADLVADMALAVGVAPGPAARAQIIARLAEAPCLVVLDNAETAWEAATVDTEEFLAQLASVRGLALVTSLREGERPGGPEWGPPIRLGPLDAGSARTLFLDIAGPRYDQPRLDDLLRQMGGVPLGIELLAHNAEREDGIDALAKRWQQEGTLLLQRAGGDSSRVSVLIAFEMSWKSRLMTDPARRLLTLLSRLPDGIARDDLDQVLPGEGDAAASTLQARGLAFYEAGRVRTHALWRHHVRDLHQPQAADWQRAVTHYLRSGRQLAAAVGGPVGAEAAQHLARDAANVRVAVVDALGADEPAEALQAAAVLLDAARFAALDLGGLPDITFAAAQRTSDTVHAGQALVALGAFFRERSDTQRARGYLSQALDRYRQAGDLHGEAMCAEWLGSCARDSSDVAAARDYYGQALGLYRRLGDLQGEANCLRGLGHCDRVSSRLESATDYYKKAIALYRQVPDMYGEANCVCRLGDCARDSGEVNIARGYYDQALGLYRQIGDLHGEANALLGLGDCARSRSETDLAREHYQKAQELYRKVGHARGERDVLHRLHLTDTDQGAPDKGASSP